MSRRTGDVFLLDRVITAMKRAADAADDDGALDDYEETLEAFLSMQSRLIGHPNLELTEKQRKWVQDFDEKTGGGIHYENLISSGKAPRGLREVPTPAVLQNLPKKPPGRR